MATTMRIWDSHDPAYVYAIFEQDGFVHASLNVDGAAPSVVRIVLESAPADDMHWRIVIRNWIVLR